MLTIDLNCDIGEGMPNDAELMPLISSANIACGGHAGDNSSIRRTIDLAITHNVAIGAHPSYPDKKDFGRTDLLGKTILLKDVPLFLEEQINRVVVICREKGVAMRHIKPHGALYNRAAADPELADVICASIRNIDPHLLLFGLSGSAMKKAAEDHGIIFVSEVFADRSYQDNGALTPRSHANAMIVDEAASEQQVVEMIKGKRVRSVNNNWVPIDAATVCLHGDGTHAVAFAKRIRAALQREEMAVVAPWFKQHR